MSRTLTGWPPWASLIALVVGGVVALMGCAGWVRAGDKKGVVYRLDNVQVHRGFSLRSADKPMLLTPATPSGGEIIKGRPGPLEISLSTYWYTHKAVLTVDAPEMVTEGQEVTLTATFASTFDLKEEIDSSGEAYVSVRMGLPVADVQTQKGPMKPGRFTLKASKSVKVRFDGKDYAPGKDFGGVLAYSTAKGVRYAKFGIDGRTSLSNQALFSVYFHYRADSATPTPSGKIDIAVTGEKIAGKAFTLTAKVHEPAPGQTVRLELPPGLELASGQQVEPVPKPAAGNTTSVVSWQVKPDRAGRFELKISSGTGPVTPLLVTIAPETPAALGKVLLSLPKESSVSRPFTVTARVTDPAPDQAVTLNLPAKLERLEGAERQVPPAGVKEPVLAWVVKALEPGQFRIHVRSSTGAEAEKSITITPPREYNALDAERALKMWTGLIPVEMELDVNGDGHVDSHDARLILQMAGARPEKRP